MTWVTKNRTTLVMLAAVVVAAYVFYYVANDIAPSMYVAAWGYAIPLVLAALVGVIGERSGVVNIGIEGQMLIAAFAGFFAAAYSGSMLVGVLGMRPVHTLARGPHLHVDDLVVDEQARSGGIGKALLAFAEEDAQARGLGAVFLDARREAIPFYERERYLFHPAPSMKKLLGG